jgi:hypothetical protein
MEKMKKKNEIKKKKLSNKEKEKNVADFLEGFCWSRTNTPIDYNLYIG